MGFLAPSRAMRGAWAVLILLLIGAVAGCVDFDGGLDPQAAGIPEGLLPVEVRRSLAVDPTRWSGEPSILALDDGTLLVTGAGGLTRYVENPADIVGNAGQSYLWRSADDGATWEFVDLGLPAPLAPALPYRNAILGVEGDLAQDEAGRAYFVDLAALAANGLSVSADSGASWRETQNPLVGQPLTDRPWVAAMGDGEVWVKYLSMAGGHRVARSSDAGLTFLEDVALPPCGQGQIVADIADRSVLVPCLGDKEIFLLRSASGPMAWEEVPVLSLDGEPGLVFPSVAVAAQGQYVFAWAERVGDASLVRASASLDRGATWSAPVTLSAPGHAAVFPWVDANAAGDVGIVWYEADQQGSPDEIDADWSAMHATLRLDPAGGLGAPSVTRLAEEPVHRGSICTAGLGCVLGGRSDDRRLLDFFEVDVDARGRSHVAWTNTQTDVPTVWYGQVARGDA